MKNLRYSIIYAVIRPEISEQVSVGIIIIVGEEIDVRYSSDKLNALKGLLPDKKRSFITQVVSSLKDNKAVDSVEAVNYLSRYSNNLICVSPIQAVDVPPTEENKQWLYRNYVCDKQ